MINTGKLAGRTIFITGASRGIGKSIALKAAKDGANIIVAAKTANLHAKLPGTIYTAAEEIEKNGGRALPCVVDIQNEDQVVSAVQDAVNTFGGIDVVINNASAISLTGTLSTSMKKYDLMNNINTRGTFLVSKVCIPYLMKSKNPHIVNISPPLSIKSIWFKDHVAYTISKFGMSMCALGMAEEFKNDGIAVNAVWPKTAIHTAAIEMLAGPDSSNYSRKPEIMADAVYALICKDSRSITGQFLTDEEILKNEGITDFTNYACNPANKNKLMPDFFLEENLEELSLQDAAKTNNMRITANAAQNDRKSNEKITQILTNIETKLNKNVVDETKAVFQFDVTGEEAGTWFLDLKNGEGSIGKGKPSELPDAVLTVDTNYCLALLTGQLKPTTAFMLGKLKIEGNLNKVMKLQKFMYVLKSKL